MDEREFTSDAIGEVRWSDNGEYCCFIPHDLPHDVVLSPDTYRLVSEASNRIGRLDGYLSLMDDGMAAMISEALSTRESVDSSSIEGTMATMDDIYRAEKVCLDPVLDADRVEVMNYAEALSFGEARVSSNGRIDADLIRGLHRILMAGTRGEGKSPGEFKTVQNAIGRPGDTLQTARLVPAPPHAVDHLLDNMFGYLDSDADDPIVKAAMVHYQFEAIHPFRDGNGRLGRLLSMLILCREGVISRPALSFSSFLAEHRSEYVDTLFRVSAEGRMEDWVALFARALAVQAEKALLTARTIAAIRDRVSYMIPGPRADEVTGMLFRNPYVVSSDLVGGLGVSKATAARMLESMERSGVLREVTGRARSRVYLCDRALAALSGRIDRGEIRI